METAERLFKGFEHFRSTQHPTATAVQAFEAYFDPNRRHLYKRKHWRNMLTLIRQNYGRPDYLAVKLFYECCSSDLLVPVGEIELRMRDRDRQEAKKEEERAQKRAAKAAQKQADKEARAAEKARQRAQKKADKDALADITAMAREVKRAMRKRTGDWKDKSPSLFKLTMPAGHSA
jgi:hypothetical protein